MALLTSLQSDSKNVQIFVIFQKKRWKSVDITLSIFWYRPTSATEKLTPDSRKIARLGRTQDIKWRRFASGESGIFNGGEQEQTVKIVYVFNVLP